MTSTNRVRVSACSQFELRVGELAVPVSAGARANANGRIAPEGVAETLTQS
jgi:hypothetical protein